MKLSDLVSHLNLEVHCGREGLDREVKGGYCSDLLSDVVAHASAGSVWVTLQTHPNVVAVAAMLDLSAVIITGGVPDPDTLAKAAERGLPILTSSRSTFATTGRLYDLLGGE